MRIDARTGEADFCVYHAEWMQVLRNVVWLDDKTLEFAQYKVFMSLFGPVGLAEIHKARKIIIYPVKKLVIINPIQDDDDRNVRKVTSADTKPASA